MTNNTLALQVIDEREVLGKDFTMYGTFEQPLFLARDVATWIEHSDRSKMLQGIDKDEKVKNNVLTLGGNQEMWFLTEDGLYEVLMQSRKPIAKAFKKEVKTILKSIRQNGAYIPTATPEETKKIVQKFIASKYLTEEIHDRKSVRSYIRNCDKMQLEDRTKELANILIPMKGSIKQELLDVAIKELTLLNKSLMFDSNRNTFIKNACADGIILMQDIKIGKQKTLIKRLEKVIY